jgi:response regulator RpfG family c-di-GMP phosphodiesterase
MKSSQDHLIDELQNFMDGDLERFQALGKKIIKDFKRQQRIMEQSDRRQRQEYDQLQEKLLEVKALNLEIEETQKEVVFTMGAIGESRSKETGNHVKRVAGYSKILALASGMDETEAEMLKQASPMHDIGKVTIPDAILNKPGKLDAQEFEKMKEHAVLGYEMLKHSNRALLQMAATVAHEHHEKYDGSGYPRGLKGEAIHIYGRITAIADVFDALGSNRIYKKAWEDERIFALFRSERGKHFDPVLVDLFFNHINEILLVRDAYRDIFNQSNQSGTAL